jgi:CheY-like chemotaxis protein
MRGRMASILIVDDDRDGSDALCQFLQRSGYDVSCVPDGRDALASVLARTPDLIILDMFMPQMDGGGLLEVLRCYLRLQSLPVVILTGLSDSPMVERARHLKVNAILMKGKATFEDILRAVEEELPRAPR